MVDKIRERHLSEEWVKFRLNPDNYTERQIDDLNGEVGRLYGADRDAQAGFFKRVDKEVFSIRAKQIGSVIARRKEEEMLRLHGEALEENRKYDAGLREVRDSLRSFSFLCDKLDCVPTSGHEEILYGIGLSLRQQKGREK